MRHWLCAAARMYPRVWRERYGAELEALLDEMEPAGSDLFDVLRGAVIMQVRTISSYVRLAGAIALAGVAVTAVAGLVLPGHYVSSSVIHVAAASDDRRVDPQLPDRVNMDWQEVVSRPSLSEMIRRPSFDLYKSERNRKPLEDVIEEMKRNVRIERIDQPPAQGGMAQAFRVSFSYPDKVKAKDVADALTERLRNLYAANGDTARRHGEVDIPAVQIISPANLPQAPLAPDRLAFLAWGLGLGLLSGVLTAFLRWRAKWTMKMIGFGLVGLVAGAVLFFNGWIPGWYTSNATVRVLTAPSQFQWRLMTDVELSDLVRKYDEILDRTSIAELIRAQDLYPSERGVWCLTARLIRRERICLSSH